MINADVIRGVIPVEELNISRRELIRRLGPGGDELTETEIFQKCMGAFEKAAVCRFAYAHSALSVSVPECRFDRFSIASGNLAKNLKDCSGAVIMGVTVGIGVDRLLATLKVRSQAEHFITDAIASAAVEALCDRTDDRIREENPKMAFRPRFSPGYGDCGIENQKNVLERINGQAALGITLSKSFFMTPCKSITAIMGSREI